MRMLFACSLVVGLAGVAHAQPVDEVAAPTEIKPQAIGYGAMPGGMTVPDALTLPAGAFELEALGGFGYRKGLLASNHSFLRGIGDIAFAYAPVRVLTIGIALDGRYDRHSNPSDDGYVGDPRVVLRFAKATGGTHLGLQAALWVPGKDAPSIAGSAISVEGRALASFELGPTQLSLSAGYRLDNSAKSVDDVGTLSLPDRISLGVSDYNAVVGGARLVIPGKSGYVGIEGSGDVFLGNATPPGGSVQIKAPSPIIRGAVIAGLHVSPTISLMAFVQIAKVPSLDPAMVTAMNIPLIPWEPLVAGGVAIAVRFGGPKPVTTAPIVDVGPTENACAKTGTCKSIEVVTYAEVTGSVTDPNGKPVVGAQVTIKLKNETGTATTDDKGSYTVSRLKIGKTVDGAKSLDDTGAEIAVTLVGKKPAQATLTLAEGTNKAPSIKLDPDLPPGQLRGTVRNAASGRAVAGATITIEPGGATAATDAEGRFTIDLPPGTYKATAKADKLSAQSLEFTLEPDPNGAAVIKNFELRK